jgi:hypothetical protein
MGRKRSKPVAEHIEEITPSAVPATESGDTPPGAIEQPVSEQLNPTEPDIFDQVIAARAAAQAKQPDAAPVTPDTVTSVQTAPAAAPVVRASELITAAGEPGEVKAHGPITISDTIQNPRVLDDISLDTNKNGLRTRLLRYQYRHNREVHHEVWIQFDKKPGKEITDPIKDAGFRWEPRAEVGENNGAWVKPLEPGSEVRIMLDAERLFKKLGNEIRAANGLEPAGMTGVGAG